MFAYMPDARVNKTGGIMARDKAVSKADLIDSVAEQTGLKKREVKAVFANKICS